mgnify:CR=1 FL=1
MSEWKEYTIGEICSRFSSGKSIKASQISAEGLYPVYGGNGLRGFTDTFNFDGECSIIGRQGAYCGNVRYFKGKAFMTEHAIVAVVNENHNNGYVSNLLSMMNLAQYQGQSAQPGLSVSTLSKITIKLPDLATQEQCFNVLNLIDQKIQINNQINQELEVMAKTLYDYWFVQFDFPDQNSKPYKSSGGKMVYNPELKREIPEGWGVEKLKDKLSVSRGISYKTENIKDNIGTPMINLASIDINRNYKSTGLKYFNGDYLKEKIVSGGDLLIACTDLTRNADIVGSPIIVPFDEQNYVFSMDLAKIDSKVDYINKYYLYSTLRTEHYHNYIKNWASGTNVLHLNIDGINWYSISIPPVELQEEYSKIILKFSKKTNKNIQENQQLSQLRDWLLPMLMNGQVKVE